MSNKVFAGIRRPWPAQFCSYSSRFHFIDAYKWTCLVSMYPRSAFGTQRALFYSWGPQLDLRGNSTAPFLSHRLVSAVEADILRLPIRSSNLLLVSRLSANQPSHPSVPSGHLLGILTTLQGTHCSGERSGTSISESVGLWKRRRQSRWEIVSSFVPG